MLAVVSDSAEGSIAKEAARAETDSATIPCFSSRSSAAPLRKLLAKKKTNTAIAVRRFARFLHFLPVRCCSRIRRNLLHLSTAIKYLALTTRGGETIGFPTPLR